VAKRIAEVAGEPWLHTVFEQIAPALVAMGHAPDGAQRLTPQGLGQARVRIDRPPDAAARVDITVEKTEALTLLPRDQPQLQHPV